MAGNRTRINCLEGNYAHHYTTIATVGIVTKITRTWMLVMPSSQKISLKRESFTVYLLHCCFFFVYKQLISILKSKREIYSANGLMYVLLFPLNKHVFNAALGLRMAAKYSSCILWRKKQKTMKKPLSSLWFSSFNVWKCTLMFKVSRTLTWNEWNKKHFSRVFMNPLPSILRWWGNWGRLYPPGFGEKLNFRIRGLIF